MEWKTEEEFEESPEIIKANYCPETQEVFYIVDNAEKDGFIDEDYSLLYYPNRNKEIETISFIDSFTTVESALEQLKEKTDSV